MRNGPGTLRIDTKMLRIGTKMLRIGTKMLRIGTKMLRIGTKMLRIGIPMLRTGRDGAHGSPGTAVASTEWRVPADRYAGGGAVDARFAVPASIRGFSRRLTRGASG